MATTTESPLHLSAAGRLDRRMHAALLIWFLFSGMTGLVYEIIWTRMFTTFFGASLPAVSTVTACFLFGLGLGARWLGARADRMARPLAAYGVLEIAVAAYALASPLLMAGIERALAPVLGAPAAVLVPVRILAAMLFLLPPTMCMGGTLPILVRFWNQRDPGFASRLSALYAVNTMGAAVGALVVGSALLALLGMWPGLAIAAAVNASIGVVALLWRVEASRPTQPPEPGGSDRADSPRVRGAGGAAAWLSLVAVLLGATSLLHQVAWSRALAPFFGSSVYAVSAVIGSFLTGIALGSLLLPRFLRACPDERKLLSSLQLRLAFYTLFFTAVVPLLPAVYLALYRALSGQFWLFLAGQYALILALTLVPTAIMGASFPLLCLLACPEGEDVGDATGRVYFRNSFGNLVGALATGFVLVPAIGIQRTIVLGIAINAGIGLALAFGGVQIADCRLQIARGRRARGERRHALYQAAVLLVFWALVPTWSRETLTAGPYAVAAMLGGVDLPRAAVSEPSSVISEPPGAPARLPSSVSRPGPHTPTLPHPPTTTAAQDALVRRGFTADFRVIYYREGAHCSVSVAEDASGIRTLAVDGKADASTAPHDMANQMLVGHIPLMVYGQGRSSELGEKGRTGEGENGGRGEQARFSGPVEAHGSGARTRVPALPFSRSPLLPFSPGAGQAGAAGASVLVVGLGSGVTVGACAQHAVRALDCVEIEPAVYGAARFFDEANGHVLTDPRVRMYYEDARAFLRAAPGRYDVIVSEPTNLWMGGVSHLFTREHFARCRQALAPDGIFCQWLHLYQIGPDDFRMALRTLLEVFPRVSVFLASHADAIIVAGGPEAPALVPAWPRDPRVLADLARVGVTDPGDPRLRPCATERGLEPRLRDVPVNTDGHPRLEFSTARHQFSDRSAEIAAWLAHSADRR